jgi:hypothetical protein
MTTTGALPSNSELLQMIDALDPQVARRLLLSHNGNIVGVLDAQSDHPVDANTMVIMTPIDADFFADGYLKGLPVAPGRWAVLWQNVYDLANQNVAIKMHEFQSAKVPVDRAVVIISVAKSSAEVRGMVLFAVDNGVPLENCRVECGWMAQSVIDELTHDFGEEWAEKALVTRNVLTDDKASETNLARELNLPEKDLTYIPARVAALM